jgi:paraquat-inducible protein B
MSKPASKTLIGAFVLGALGLIIAGAVVFGSGKFLRKVYKNVMFFEGSVQGLQIGAPVVFRGVQIGHITNIVMEVNSKDLTAFIPVYTEIYPDKVVPIGGDGDHGGDQQYFQALIEKGLRARLEPQSIVTGQFVINVDFYPNTPIRLVGLEKEYPEIPTIPSGIEQLKKRIEELPLAEIADRLNETLAGMNKLLNSRDLHASIGSLNQLLKNTDALVTNLNTEVGHLDAEQIASNIKETLSASRGTLNETRKAVENINVIAAQNANLGYEIGGTLEQINDLSRSIRVLADYLERHPETLLRGKSPARGD